jgi:hypothetical protein
MLNSQRFDFTRITDNSRIEASQALLFLPTDYIGHTSATYFEVFFVLRKLSARRVNSTQAASS